MLGLIRKAQWRRRIDGDGVCGGTGDGGSERTLSVDKWVNTNKWFNCRINLAALIVRGLSQLSEWKEGLGGVYLFHIGLVLWMKPRHVAVINHKSNYEWFISIWSLLYRPSHQTSVGLGWVGVKTDVYWHVIAWTRISLMMSTKIFIGKTSHCLIIRSIGSKRQINPCNQSPFRSFNYPL